MREVNLDQVRAAYAWERVSQAPGGGEYENLAKSAPALIMNSGLMQILAFLKDKAGEKKDHHSALLNDLCLWLAQGKEHDNRTYGGILGCEAKYDSVMRALYDTRPDIYRQATVEAFAVLRWIRQFAAARNARGNRGQQEERHG